MQLSNYLFFTTECEKALAFYRECGLGRVTEMLRYGADGLPAGSDGMRGKIMHARFEGPGVLFYASDNDVALMTSESVHGGIPRAGRVPLQDMQYVGKPELYGRVDLVDATLAPGDPAAGHGYFALAYEMVDLITATRAYEANLSVVKSAKQMAMKALEIGK